MADIGDAQKAIRMVVFPEGTRRVELNVAPNGLELARVEGKLDVGAAVEAERRTDGGLRPPHPLRRRGLCSQNPQPREGFGAGEALVHEPLDLGRRGALVGEDFGEVRGRLRGRGGIAPFRWASAASMAFMSAKLAQSGLKPGARHVR